MSTRLILCVGGPLHLQLVEVPTDNSCLRITGPGPEPLEGKPPDFYTALEDPPPVSYWREGDLAPSGCPPPTVRYRLKKKILRRKDGRVLSLYTYRYEEE